jgi:uncharacterized membrane protein YhiD involved in acid resistance
MFDFAPISFNGEDPTYMTMVMTVLFSFFLSGMIVFTYDKTSRNVVKPIHFMQAMILISIVTATVMQAIGDSLARGLGMLGALSVIRFRTTVKNPRNIVFMFSSLAVGIACGVYGFQIAFIGTVGFCLAAFILRFTPFSQKENLLGKLTLILPTDSDDLKKLQIILKKHSQYFELISYKIIQSKKKKKIEYVYDVKLKEELGGNELITALETLETARRIRLDFATAMVDVI